MLSRRNVRIKIMQVLYAAKQDPVINLQEIFKRYQQTINDSFDLYLYSLWLLKVIISEDKKMAERKKAKLIQTDEDAIFQPKLGTNPLSQSLTMNENLNRIFNKKEWKSDAIDSSIPLNIYKDFIKTEEYKSYQKALNTDVADHQKVLLALMKFCFTDERFVDIIEDFRPSWIDDHSILVGTLKKTIKALPVFGDFYNKYLPDETATQAFGKELIVQLYQKMESINDEIIPTLTNWDASRVAVLDMICIKLAVCELVTFPSIPAKVTVNEYVEIAKMYSTDKSKEFVNGVLDKLMKKMIAENKIKKEGRGIE